MSHCDAMRVTQAFKRDEKAGKGFENITANLAGNQDGKRDFSTRLCATERQPRRGCEEEEGAVKKLKERLEGKGNVEKQRLRKR